MRHNLRPLAKQALLVVLMVLITIKGILPAWSNVHSDFGNYYVSSKLVVDGESLDLLYDNEWFHQKIIDYGLSTPGKFSPYPPLTAWMMVPIAYFQPLTAQRVFTVFNLALVALAIWLLSRIASLTMRRSALVVLGCGLSLINNIAFGQTYLLLTVVLLVALLLFEHDRLISASILVGLFTALKYFPIVLIAGYLLNGVASGSVSAKKDLRMGVYATACSIAFVLVQIPLFGKNVFADFINTSFLPHLDGQFIGQGQYSYYYQSWDSLFRNLFVYDPQFNPDPFINLSTARPLLKIVVVLAVAISTLSVLLKYRNAQPELRRSVFLAVPAAAALVLLPASASYHLILLLIPVVLILRDNLLENRVLVAVLISFFLIGYIPYGLAFNLAESWGLLFAYPRLILLTMFFVFVTIGYYRAANSRVSKNGVLHFSR